MEDQDVISLYNKLDSLGVKIRIDGGWAVDALLGEQTRPHDDVDIVIQQKDVPKLRELLESQGYHDVERDDTSAWNFLLGDNKGRLIDVHAIIFDAQGNGLYGPVEKGVMYPAAALTGHGKINKQSVRCISAEYMVKFISLWLYKLRDKDINAVSALCEKFGIDYPKEYKELIRKA